MDNVGYNRRGTVAKEIAHIHFTTLTSLNLEGSNIESIEGLARVCMPHIQALNLGTYDDNREQNSITSVGVIRKAAWPDLQSLNLSKE
jgi:hypothetical protein